MIRPPFDFYAAISGTSQRFRGLLPRAQTTQRLRLQALLRRNAGTEFGRRHGFASIRDEAGYRARVPVTTYDELEPSIQRMARGEAGVLVADPVVAFEETGGSTSGSKLIPHTEASLQAIRGALVPWLDDLAQACPAIARGRAYWSVSPATRIPRATPAGARIGLADAEYFGADLAPLLAETLAVVPGGGGQDMERWREETRRQLAACRDLALISVWSPTFLSGLTDEHARWPGLQVISCWDQGASRPYADALRAQFPGVRVQGKGLLATEGVVSIPLHDLAMPVLAVDSAFFEFQDDAGRVCLPAETAAGGEYHVIITTDGGLYRYALGDRVRVHGFAGEAPMLEFLGRGAQVSDLCGEKLTEPFVLSALQPLGLRFAAVAPEEAPQRRYVLYVDAQEIAAGSVPALAARADAELQRNPQYAYAREIGQLAPLEARRCALPLDAWQRTGLARGQRLGDIKPPALCLDASAASRFSEAAQ